MNEFNSLHEVLIFHRNHHQGQQQIISEHTSFIKQEIGRLEKEIADLTAFISEKRKEVENQLQSELDNLTQQLEQVSSNSSNFLLSFICYYRKIWIKGKIKNNKLNFESNIQHSTKELELSLNVKRNRYQFITSSFDDAVKQSSKLQLIEFERKHRIIEEVESSIFGAIGEHKVVKELEKLSDDYILINDFTHSFHQEIYWRQGNVKIKSVQIDHILISSAGVFLIETKNWSERSLQDANLRSPVEQIRRANFALFKILANEMTKSTLSLDKHHWGEKRIPIKNLIVLINQKPTEEFQYVKVLTLEELRNYVQYFKPILSKNEVQDIANYLLKSKT